MHIVLKLFHCWLIKKSASDQGTFHCRVAIMSSDLPFILVPFDVQFIVFHPIRILCPGLTNVLALLNQVKHYCFLFVYFCFRKSHTRKEFLWHPEFEISALFSTVNNAYKQNMFTSYWINSVVLNSSITTSSTIGLIHIEALDQLRFIQKATIIKNFFKSSWLIEISKIPLW